MRNQLMAVPAMTDIQTIESGRIRLKISGAELCRLSGVSWRAYADARDGKAEPRKATLARLQRAIASARSGKGQEARQLGPAAALKILIALVARERETDPAAALSSDPSLRATFSVEWSDHATTRRIAIYLANGAMGFRTSDIGRALGLTKQAVSLAVREIEDRRDESADLDALLTQIERWLACQP
jgi:hypothetical protein